MGVVSGVVLDEVPSSLAASFRAVIAGSPSRLDLRSFTTNTRCLLDLSLKLRSMWHWPTTCRCSLDGP